MSDKTSTFQPAAVISCRNIEDRKVAISCLSPFQIKSEHIIAGNIHLLKTRKLKIKTKFRLLLAKALLNRNKNFCVDVGK